MADAVQKSESKPKASYDSSQQAEPLASTGRLRLPVPHESRLPVPHTFSAPTQRRKSLARKLLAQELATVLNSYDAPLAEPAACAAMVRHVCDELKLDVPTSLAIFQLAGIDAELLSHELTRRVRQVLQAEITATAINAIAADEHGFDLLLDFYELFLTASNPKLRRRRGVFYTPQPIARMIVRAIHQSLREDFNLADGLADECSWRRMCERNRLLALPENVDPDSDFIRVLDPAAGTGMFLLEAARTIHETFFLGWRERGVSEHQIRERWQDYVPAHLLPRLCGYEILPMPATLAKARLAIWLASTGYKITGDEQLAIECRDAMLPPEEDFRPATAIVGNPPFSGVSQNRHGWIEGLLRGRDTCPRTLRSEGMAPGLSTASYYDVDGRPLGEKKVWLQDDYVKFLRLAQWHVDRASAGIVGYVTNHGYLENPTFRGLRQKLLASFTKLQLLDLHGSAIQGKPAGGIVDQNVFEIEAGVAVALLVQPPDPKDSNRLVCIGELFGTRAEKLQCLAAASLDALARTPIAPTAPWYLFAAHSASGEAMPEEYARAWRLCDAMPVNTTAAVTARDQLVVAGDETELRERIAAFCDISTSDEAIRQQYGGRTRSASYLPGDTRGWKLAEARAALAGDFSWREKIHALQYRPLDWRAILWDERMIDWPRGAVMRELLERNSPEENIALIARRQSPAQVPAHYFWATRGIVLDGLVRSDNRGSESVFPLWVNNAANFHADFLREVAARLGEPPAPRALLAYIYALFHSPNYRQRYASAMWVDFPRVLLTSRRELFFELAGIGEELLQLHACRFAAEIAGTQRRPAQLDSSTNSDYLCHWHRIHPPLIEKGFPRHRDDRVEINAGCWLSGVSAETWAFHVGSHQVCRKWLKDRRGELLTDRALAEYAHATQVIATTIQRMGGIDAAIAQHGGWPAAFE